MSSELAYAIQPADVGLTGFNNLGEVITKIIPVIVSLSGLALFIYLMMGGLKYITSGGDEKAIQEARKIITNALFGMLVVFLSFWLVRIIETVLGLKITGF